MNTISTEAALRRAQARADAAYQFVVCLGLAVAAAFVGTVGAYMTHAGI